TVVHGLLVGLGGVELHTVLVRAGAPATLDASGVEQCLCGRLVVPGGAGTERVDPVQLDVGAAVAVVGPAHPGAQHRGVDDGPGFEFDRESEQGPAGVDAVPFQAPDAHAGGLGVVVGLLGEGTVDVGPVGGFGLGPGSVRMRGGGREVLGV